MEIAIGIVGGIVAICVIAGMLLLTPARSELVRTSLDDDADAQGTDLSPREPGTRT